MENKELSAPGRLAGAGIEKCLGRLSRAYSGAWRLLGVSVFPGSMADAVGRHDFKDGAAAVHVNVQSAQPFLTVLLFGSGDVGHIAKCFLAEPFSEAREIAQFEDVMLLEIGNMILNALINSLLNAIKQSAVPSVPGLLKGDARSILGGLGGMIDTAAGARVIVADISIELDGRTCRGEVAAVIPEELAARMESAA
ncbi:MAG TPA: hypothetical protein DCZ92_12425 [Elusimicrobia bacterium]|nr:MAG: hypothetical protein A2016_02030 [Elusimicrobia bacterium GWF2_62_30]HBA61594.1 hypothetical protein [Elusimicrobiota bacterium]